MALAVRAPPAASAIARRSMISRWWGSADAASSAALGLRAASAGRAAPAPRAAPGCRARPRPSASWTRIGRRFLLRPRRRTAADRRAPRRCRRSRRGPPRAWRAPTWRGRAPAAAGRPAWRRRCRSCGRRGRRRLRGAGRDRPSIRARGHGGARGASSRSGEPGQLVIMGGEQAAACDSVVDRLDHRPGDGEAVIGRGAAADLVEDDEAAAASPGRGSPRSRPSRP